MSDLIISINLDESRRKQGLVIETYEGVIPHLKSKKYSGQLRNANLSSVFSVDNLQDAELKKIKDIFNDSSNLQISKYQYIYSVSLLPFLQTLVKFKCLFCKDKKNSPMYMLEEIKLNTNMEQMSVIHDFSVCQKETVLYINYDTEKKSEIKKETIPLLYVDVTSPDYRAKLYFDYGDDFVKAEDKEMYLDNEGTFRDYRFEKEVISRIENSHWKSYERDSYIYIGKDIYFDLNYLSQTGINLYTNERKKISLIDFSNVSVSYGIDWFELSGNAQAGESDIPFGDLVDFKKNKNDWTEYKGQILFIPSGLKNLKNKIEKDGKCIKVSKNDILAALETIDYFDGRSLSSFNQLYSYQDIELKLPFGIKSILRKYQEVGVKWLLSLRSNGFGGCLADDMGLGKTLQIIAYLSDESQGNSKALIVVPKTLIENWRREFTKFMPSFSTYIYHGTSRNIKEARKSRAIITTYGTLLNDIDIIKNIAFDHLIVDEAQNIKNSRSKAYRAVRLVQAQTKIIMTGTPLENNIDEFWGLMKISNPTSLSLKSIASGLDGHQVVERVKKITKPFILRRYKKDVLKDLPAKEEQTIYCELDEQQKMLYDTMLESIRYEINRKADRYELKTNSIVLSGLLYLQEICCHPKLLPNEYNKTKCTESAKLDQLMSMISELYITGHKIVVFSRFTRMLGIINKEVVKRHFNVFYLDGNTSNRQRVVDEFENSKEGVFLISLKAGGVGLNLVSADIAIIFDPWWNPAVEKQAEDRIYRIGQKNNVTIYKLIAANTIEEKVQDLQETKRRLFDDVIEGHEIPQNLTMNDIKQLML